MGKKIYLVCIFTVLTVIALFTGCNLQQPKGNYDVFECMEKLDYTTSYKDAVKIIGFEGELIDEKDEAPYPYETYEWK